MTANLNNSPIVVKPQKPLPSNMVATAQKSNVTTANVENRRISPTGAAGNITPNSNKLFTPIDANYNSNNTAATSPTPSQASSTGIRHLIAF